MYEEPECFVKTSEGNTGCFKVVEASSLSGDIGLLEADKQKFQEFLSKFV